MLGEVGEADVHDVMFVGSKRRARFACQSSCLCDEPED